MLVMSGGLIMTAVPAIGLGAYLWLSIAAAFTGMGIGLSAPASNNACIELAPDNVGAIMGIRGAARQSGAIIAISVATSMATRSSNEPLTLSKSFLVLGALLLGATPLALLVPDGRQRWRKNNSTLESRT
jgi:MFS family permease